MKTENQVANPPPTRIKICGLTRGEDAKLALQLGAWALGFIFYAKSPRYVSPEKVAEILRELRLHSSIAKDQSPPESIAQNSSAVKTVGVMVNPTLADLSEVVKIAGINTLQLHGKESESFVESVRKQFPQLTLIKAFRLEEYRADFPTDFQLLDSASTDAWGGTGLTVDWQKTTHFVKKSLILAGGLTTENVATAISMVNPYAIDVSSGIETAPGIKSKEKLIQFFDATKGSQRALSS